MFDMDERLMKDIGLPAEQIRAVLASVHVNRKGLLLGLGAVRTWPGASEVNFRNVRVCPGDVQADRH